MIAVHITDAEIDEILAGLKVEPPGEFKEYGNDIKTDYECPKCHYKWSGKPG